MLLTLPTLAFKDNITLSHEFLLLLIEKTNITSNNYLIFSNNISFTFFNIFHL